VKSIPSLQVLLGILCFVCVSVARGAVAKASEPRVVYVVASGDAADTAGVEVVVRELVARLPVELQWSRASGIDPGQVLAQRAPEVQVVARAWLDLSDAKRARIYVANAQGRRFLVRVVPLRDGYDEVAREVLGHIIESAVDAFLSGLDVGVTREVAERQVTAESPPPPAAPATASAPPAATSNRFEWLRLGVVVAYRATQIAQLPTILHGPTLGMALAIPIRGSVRFSSSAMLHYRLPTAWDSASVGARVAGATARLSAGLEADVARQVILRGELGVGADFTHLAPYAEPSDRMAKAGQPLWTTSSVAAAMLSLELAASSRIGLLVGAGCDVELNHPSYFVARNAQQTTVLSPWVVHPTATLGLVFRVDRQPIEQHR
jgi:hypothetical protein